MSSKTEGDFYVSTYCNFAHSLLDGSPIGHECRDIPVAALEAEMDGDYELAISLLNRQFEEET